MGTPDGGQWAGDYVVDTGPRQGLAEQVDGPFLKGRRWGAGEASCQRGRPIQGSCVNQVIVGRPLTRTSDISAGQDGRSWVLGLGIVEPPWVYQMQSKSNSRLFFPRKLNSPS